jgi:hypothetical protein
MDNRRNRSICLITPELGKALALLRLSGMKIEREIAVGTILIIVILVVLLGGGGGFYAHGRYGGRGSGGVLGLILIILIIIWLLGGFHGFHNGV